GLDGPDAGAAGHTHVPTPPGGGAAGHTHVPTPPSGGDAGSHSHTPTPPKGGDAGSHSHTPTPPAHGQEAVSHASAPLAQHPTQPAGAHAHGGTAVARSGGLASRDGGS